MRLPIRLAVAAVEDRKRLAEFLVAVDPGAAERAVDAIGRALERLSDFPEMGHAAAEGLELGIRFGNSGYVVQYRIDADAVVIARIFHMRENRDLG